MALTAVIDVTATPITLTVTSDRRKLTITCGGDAVVALWPISIRDPTGRTWTVKSDDGSVAVYVGA